MGGLMASMPYYLHSKDYFEASEKEKTMLDEKISFMWNSYASEQTIIKSLAIVLAQLLTREYNLSKNKTHHLIADIFAALFGCVDYKINSVDLFDGIYLKSALFGVPIYGSNKNGYRKSEAEIKALVRKIFKDLTDTKLSDNLCNIFMYGAHKSELLKYPVTLLKE